MLVRIGKNFVYLLKIFPGLDYPILFVLFLLLGRTVLLAIERLASSTFMPSIQKKVHTFSLRRPTAKPDRPGQQEKPVIRNERRRGRAEGQSAGN